MRFLGMTFSEGEVKELALAWVLLSAAFTLVYTGVSFSITVFIVSLLTVGTGFLFHELGHKLLAQKYGCWAEFRAFKEMLLLALVMSFFGFVFAAPGAVMIHGHMTRKQYGMVAAAGPFINYVLAIGFLLGTIVLPGNVVLYYGFFINSWLGLFNMLPFGMFDGAKIMRWSKGVYGGMVVVGFLLLILQATNLI